MKRRAFIGKAVLTGLAGAALPKRCPSVAGSSHRVGEKPPLSRKSRAVLRLDGAYYRHYPVDFSRGELGALGMKGWGETIAVEAPVRETALISMHAENIGLVPEIPWADRGPLAGYMRWLEYEGRKIEIVRTVYPRILAAAREAGIPVVHVAMGDYAKKYPGYRKALDLSGAEPAVTTPRAPGSDRVRPPDDVKPKLIFGEHYNDNRDEEHFGRYFDFPEQARPREDEFVVETSYQLSCVLNDLGVWNLIYIGFAINWCLWFSGGGMVDMSRLGYRCSCIKEAVTAVENRESIRGEQHKEEAMWRTSLMFGYIFRGEDFISACRALGANRP